MEHWVLSLHCTLQTPVGHFKIQPLLYFCVYEFILCVSMCISISCTLLQKSRFWILGQKCATGELRWLAVKFQISPPFIRYIYIYMYVYSITGDCEGLVSELCWWVFIFKELFCQIKIKSRHLTRMPPWWGLQKCYAGRRPVPRTTLGMPRCPRRKAGEGLCFSRNSSKDGCMQIRFMSKTHDNIWVWMVEVLNLFRCFTDWSLSVAGKYKWQC